MPPPKKKKPQRQYKPGDKVSINLHRGHIEEANVRKVIQSPEGTKYQVDFGHEQTALISDWQIVDD